MESDFVVGAQGSGNRSIALIGMMGAGKTTVGKALAAKLSWSFYDSDARIEESTGLGVAEIFRRHGEEAFREWEADAVREAVQADEQVVIGVAGGAVLRTETQKLLKAEATVVWLEAPIETLIARVIHRHLDRPMLDNTPDENMRRLYEVRKPIYQRIADVTVSVDGRTPDYIAEHIMEVLA